MKPLLLIIASLLCLFTGSRSAITEMPVTDTIPAYPNTYDSCCDQIVGFAFYVQGNLDSLRKSYMKFDFKFPISTKTKIYEVSIGANTNIYATRDTAGKWDIKDPAKALEIMYQNWMGQDQNKWWYEDKPDKKVKPSPTPLPDTTGPKYRYVVRLPEIDAATYYRIEYVTDSIFEHWGKERGGTDIEKAKILYFNHMNYLRRLLKLDSVLVDKPKNVKP